MMIGVRGTRKGDFVCFGALRGGDGQGGGGKPAGDALCDGEAAAGWRGESAVGGEQRPGDGAC